MGSIGLAFYLAIYSLGSSRGIKGGGGYLVVLARKWVLASESESSLDPVKRNPQFNLKIKFSNFHFESAVKRSGVIAYNP